MSVTTVRCVKKVELGEVEVMKGIINLRVYYNGETILNTHEEVAFVCECPLSFAIPCIMSFVELQNDLCDNIQSHILKRVSKILYRNPVKHSGLDVVGEEVNVDEFGDIDWEEDNNNNEEEFEVNYEADDENDDGDLAGNPTVQNEADANVSQHPFGVPYFMRTLDLEAMHAPKFPEYANMGEGNVAAGDCEFSVRMEFGSRESVISAIKSYTISRVVDYTMYESEPQIFYAKYKDYGDGCNWLIRASLIRKKACWEIRRYNGQHTCTMGMISQDHAKLDSNTIADAIRSLVEADPSIKVKSVIAEVQSRFNYTVSYRKAWLAKQKSVTKVFGDWEVSYQTLPVWLKAMTAKMPRSRVQKKTLPVYHESEEVEGVRVLYAHFLELLSVYSSIDKLIAGNRLQERDDLLVYWEAKNVSHLPASPSLRRRKDEKYGFRTSIVPPMHSGVQNGLSFLLLAKRVKTQ
ncbi:hypothetical protein Ahy_B02g060685 [Arachis hypogaea]|uniref:Uncharacterized protein n=1 Tax=Arachis hypogaea TaxID=3818 RepID=A0A445AJ34_ARAHY|nr:hypothetical protein Ahy_B02g060685 [Arachis hypogaea]